jgi:FSR family fosmidomycin resistance protein-like MFS transporter
MQSKPSSQKSALAVGCTAHIVQDGLSATIYVLLPILAQSFGLTYTQVGLFKGVKSLAQAVFEMCSGIVTERIGELRVIVFGLLLSGVGYAGLAFAPSALLILVCLFVVGAGSAFQHAPASAMIISVHPIDGRRGPLGLYNSSGDIGKLTFTGCFSLAIGAGLAWQNINLIYGLSAIVAAVAIAFFASAFDKFQQAEAASSEESSDDDAELGWGILNWRSYSTLLVIVFFDTMVQAGVLVFAAFLLLSKGLPLAIAATATVIVLIGGIFGKAGCGFLADRLGVRPAFVLIQLLTAVGLFCVVAAPAWPAMLLLLPLGVVVQGSTSITYGFAADLIHPHRMARGYALLYSSSSFSSVAGPLVFGLIADAFGIQIAMYAMAMVTLLALPPIAFLSMTLTQKPRTA